MNQSNSLSIEKVDIHVKIYSENYFKLDNNISYDKEVIRFIENSYSSTGRVFLETYLNFSCPQLYFLVVAKYRLNSKNQGYFETSRLKNYVWNAEK